jgi:hypothetical protein
MAFSASEGRDSIRSGGSFNFYSVIHVTISNVGGEDTDTDLAIIDHYLVLSLPSEAENAI